MLINRKCMFCQNRRVQRKKDYLVDPELDIWQAFYVFERKGYCDGKCKDYLPSATIEKNKHGHTIEIHSERGLLGTQYVGRRMR